MVRRPITLRVPPRRNDAEIGDKIVQFQERIHVTEALKVGFSLSEAAEYAGIAESRAIEILESCGLLKGAYRPAQSA